MSKNRNEPINSATINLHLNIKSIGFLSTIEVISEEKSSVQDVQNNLTEEIHESQLWELIQSSVGVIISAILLALIIWVKSKIRHAAVQFELLNQH